MTQRTTFASAVRNRRTARYPNMLRSIRSLWQPSMGKSGILFDMVGSQNEPATSSKSWGNSKHGMSIFYDGFSSAVRLASSALTVGVQADEALGVWFKSDSTSQTNASIFGYLRKTVSTHGRGFFYSSGTINCVSDLESGIALQLQSASSQYLELSAGDSDFNMGSGNFTITGWVYVDSLAATQYVATKHHPTATFNGFRLGILTSGNIYFALSGDGASETTINQSADPITANKWFFIVARYDGSNISIRHYDTAGLLQEKSSAHSTGMFATTKPFVVGSISNAPANTFDGRIDSLAVYKGKALSDAECDTLWNSGAGTTYYDLSAGQKTSLLAWWDMDEASGKRANMHSGSYDLIEGNGTAGPAAGITDGHSNPIISKAIPGTGWHMAVANFGTAGEFYVDGVLVGSGVLDSSGAYSRQLGSASGAGSPTATDEGNFSGEIGMAFTADRLTAGQVRWLFDNPSAILDRSKTPVVRQMVDP